MIAAPRQIEEISLDDALLRRGDFAVGEGRFLPWQAYGPPAAASAARQNIAPRGTVILLNEWGESFSDNAAAPAALAARNFITVSYCWPLAPAPPAAGRRYAAGFNYAALAAFLRRAVLPDYPAPFYLLARGSGALFALSALPLLSSAISRMVAVAPAFSPRRFSYLAAKTLSLLSAADYADAAAARASFARAAAAAAQTKLILSPRFCRAANLPCLIISAAQDSRFHRSKAFRLAEMMRLADNITVPGGPDFLQHGPAQAQRQFWAAFDAFIPGSDYEGQNAQTEYAALL